MCRQGTPGVATKLLITVDWIQFSTFARMWDLQFPTLFAPIWTLRKSISTGQIIDGIFVAYMHTSDQTIICANIWSLFVPRVHSFNIPQNQYAMRRRKEDMLVIGDHSRIRMMLPGLQEFLYIKYAKNVFPPQVDQREFCKVKCSMQRFLVGDYSLSFKSETMNAVSSTF